MINYKYETVKKEVIDTVICNKCGKSTWNSCNFEYMNCMNQWGYGSKQDGDLEMAQICEKCWDEFKAMFAIPSTIIADQYFE